MHHVYIPTGSRLVFKKALWSGWYVSVSTSLASTRSSWKSLIQCTLFVSQVSEACGAKAKTFWNPPGWHSCAPAQVCATEDALYSRKEHLSAAKKPLERLLQSAWGHARNSRSMFLCLCSFNWTKAFYRLKQTTSSTRNVLARMNIRGKSQFWSIPQKLIFKSIFDHCELL